MNSVQKWKVICAYTYVCVNGHRYFYLSYGTCACIYMLIYISIAIYTYAYIWIDTEINIGVCTTHTFTS